LKQDWSSERGVKVHRGCVYLSLIVKKYSEFGKVEVGPLQDRAAEVPDVNKLVYIRQCMKGGSTRDIHRGLSACQRKPPGTTKVRI
jgi:hypothetical protein